MARSFRPPSASRDRTRPVLDAGGKQPHRAGFHKRDEEKSANAAAQFPASSKAAAAFAGIQLALAPAPGCSERAACRGCRRGGRATPEALTPGLLLLRCHAIYSVGLRCAAAGKRRRPCDGPRSSCRIDEVLLRAMSPWASGGDYRSETLKQRCRALSASHSFTGICGMRRAGCPPTVPSTATAPANRARKRGRLSFIRPAFMRVSNRSGTRTVSAVNLAVFC